MTDRKEVYAQIESHYRAHRSNFVSKLSNQLGKAQAEDVVQDAYTRALQYWKSFDTAQSVEQWIVGILGNCIRDAKRDAILNGMVVEDLAVIPEPPRFNMVDHIAMIELIEEIAAIKNSTNRVVTQLYLLDGYTSKEVSEVIEISPESVRKIVSRFREEYLDKHRTADARRA